MEGFIKECIGIVMVMLGVEIVAAQRVKEATRNGESPESANPAEVPEQHAGPARERKTTEA